MEDLDEIIHNPVSWSITTRTNKFVKVDFLINGYYSDSSGVMQIRFDDIKEIVSLNKNFIWKSILIMTDGRKIKVKNSAEYILGLVK